MTDEQITEEELEEQDGEALPDPELTLDPPQEAREPGLPPPRD